MSAFVVGTDHIDYLVTAIVQWHGLHAVDTLYLTDEQAQQVAAAGGDAAAYQYGSGQVWKPAHRPDATGRLLLTENIHSVRTRYPNEPDTDLPGPRPWVHAADYSYRSVPAMHLSPAQVIRAVECWQYQTCEYTGATEAPGWLLTDRLYKVAVDRLLDGHDLQWEWDRATARQTA